VRAGLIVRTGNAGDITFDEARPPVISVHARKTTSVTPRVAQLRTIHARPAAPASGGADACPLKLEEGRDSRTGKRKPPSESLPRKTDTVYRHRVGFVVFNPDAEALRHSASRIGTGSRGEVGLLPSMQRDAARSLGAIQHGPSRSRG
jgi:hypothetical protein